MANYFAIAAGNFNNSAIWSLTPTGAGGAGIPTIGDIAIANNRAVTVNVDSACDAVVNNTLGGATNGGSFTLSNGITLVANVTSGAQCVIFGGTTGNIANLISNNIVANGGTAVLNNSTGTLNVTGNVIGSNAGSVIFAVINNSTGILNLSGNVVGGQAANSFGVENAGGGIINIVGNVTGNNTTSTSAGARNNSTGTINITGNVTGIIASGVSNSTTGIINIIGNVIGGSGTNAYGAFNSGAGFIYVNGTATGGLGSNAFGIFNNSTGLLSCTKVVGNSFGLGSVGVNSTPGASNTQNGRMYVEQVEFGPRGQTPISGPVYILPSNRNTLTGYTTALGQTVTFYNSLSVSGLLPPASSVRLGTVYNVGNTTGTMAVPSPSSVDFGVAVDNTFGTAALTPQTIWNYSRLSATQVGSMGDRLRNAATTQSVGSQIASFNL